MTLVCSGAHWGEHFLPTFRLQKPWCHCRREESGQLSKNLFSRIKECIIQTESYLKTEQKSRPVWLHSFFVLHQNGTDHLSLQHSSHPLSCATTCLTQLYRHFSNVIFWYIQEVCCCSTTWKNQGRNEEEGPSGQYPTFRLVLESGLLLPLERLCLPLPMDF